MCDEWLWELGMLFSNSVFCNSVLLQQEEPQQGVSAMLFHFGLTEPDLLPPPS